MNDTDIKSYLIGNAIYDLILVPVLDDAIVKSGTSAFKPQDSFTQLGILMAGAFYSYVAYNKKAYNSSKWWKFLIILNTLAYLNGVKGHRKLDNVGWLLLNDLAKAVMFTMCYKYISK